MNLGQAVWYEGLDERQRTEAEEALERLTYAMADFEPEVARDSPLPPPSWWHGEEAAALESQAVLTRAGTRRRD